ncbi:unnamed protein product [Orchesella dallaii]|uniref:Uncharacterized protein n=1 Tax=Orchesella dallaii TaxID=48710 RepID=A0ABP1RD55_9HEXA
MTKLKIWKRAEFLRSASIFRETQIMLKAYNNIHQNVSVIAALFQTSLLLTFAVYGLVGLHSTLLTEQLTFFASGSIQAVIVIVYVFGTFGKVYGKSKEVMIDITGMTSLKKNIWSCLNLLADSEDFIWKG